ncbi:unnamed protein product [Rotaria socialis]|uniref:Uncharacterized protein n=1 Tax=Rotaria socialis TaxID=392032 RepID=A0A821GRE5_9BILA|nr:unnamed protein product [Rotaria socialis]
MGSTTLSSNTVRPRRSMNQNYLIIWIDDNIDPANVDCQHFRKKLHDVANDVNLCTRPTGCIQLLNDLRNGNVFVISSGTIARECDHDALSMSFVSKRMMVTATQSDQQPLDQLEPSFMYSVLFKKIVLEIKEDDKKINKRSRTLCRQVDIFQSQLNDFQPEYHYAAA